MTAPPARRDFPALNGARAVAAYVVVATHAGFTSGRSLGTGAFAGVLARLDFGVTLFFLLSGFLLSRQFLADPARLHPAGVRHFWRRRLLRILPAYWLATATVLAVLGPGNPSLSQWLSYMLMVQDYDNQAGNPALSQMWTLSVELQFYFLLPLLLYLARRVRGGPPRQLAVLVVGMWLVSLGCEIGLHAGYGPAGQPYLWLPLYLDWFALGIVLAAVSTARQDAPRWLREPVRWAQSAGTCWIIGALLFWLATLPLGGPRDLTSPTGWEWTFKHQLYGAAAFFLLLPLVAGTARWTDQLLGNRTMSWLGEVSYGVYLWHLALLLRIQQWFGWPIFGGHFWELFLATAAAATVVAGLSWHLVERPLLRRYSTSWRRSAPPPRAPSAPDPVPVPSTS